MNKLKIIVIVSVLLLSVVSINQAFAVTTTDTLFFCNSPEGSSTGKPAIVGIADKTTGLYLSNSTLVVSGFTVKGCNGMAVDPTTGIFYAVMTHQANTTDRRLITLDPTTGVGTDIGSMGDKMATLGFLADGSLRTIAGTASPDSEKYYSVNKLTGQTTPLCTLSATGAGDQGQALALNYDDNKIYHMRGTLTTTGFPPVNNTFNQLSTVDGEVGTPTECPITVVANPTSNFNQTALQTFGTLGETLGMTYNTNDQLFYAYSFNKYYSMTSTGFNILLKNAPNGSGQPEQEMKGMAFSIILVSDTTDPVISTTVSEPIPIQQGSVFDPFEFVQCIDDTDGDITNTMVVDGTVDTSKPKSYFVDYNCTDIATNSATLLNVHYIVKRSGTGSGGEAVSAPTTTTIAPTGDGVTPLLSVVPEPEGEIDRAFNLFDALNELFAPTQPTVPTAPTPPTLEQVRQQNLIEAIQSFFASLFG